nr:immunoglobulin light chain junction region [Macaca mulatta]MOW08459.1 immunoglobulin light chain junction region [Macaca mulatta]MOW09566.1 immunoglobulin light chain junction region [Macaca mulatta]MOW09669.1 immunoglobulin light chain junction region [Macaca mulatta]MOW10905.1 immunoglobulin light chain junction region [Macaca mulatta]
CQKYITSPPTF